MTNVMFLNNMIIWYILGFLIILVIVLTIINVLQNGGIQEFKYANYLLNDLGVLQPEDFIVKLTKREVFLIFQFIPKPEPWDLEGDMIAYNLPQGVLSFVVNLITDHLFGPGKWIGKGFHSETLTGYNLFTQAGQTHRGREFEVKDVKSEIDGRPSIQLDYRNKQKGIIAGSMRDEIRKVNDKIYLGMGMTSWGLGSMNPAHFILIKTNE